jgi:hypothetical protein
MSKRISVTERLMEDRPVGRGFQAVFGSAPDEKNTRHPEEKSTRRMEGQSAGPQPNKLVKATFLLDPESLDILDGIWLRQRKTDGLSKSALVRQAIHLLNNG